jgi:ketosteroid isomerase-like protein
MSQQNMDFVRQFLEGAPDDMAAALRDEEELDALREALAAVVHPEFETVMIGPEYDPTPTALGPYNGVEGLFEAWRGWFGPWAEFRIDVDDLLDAGDRVVVMVRQRGRMESGAPEVVTQSALIATIREDRVARLEFFYDRVSALRSAGLDPAAGK